ncbi:glycosyltransferase [Clostridium botulinum]|uniref:glycosyltransferase n=1 Tax=Clostridium botulinum TaxID=1491 RepID=UPI001FA7C08C|nr:glycosyltransferase [Clostridium botulinum]
MKSQNIIRKMLEMIDTLIEAGDHIYKIAIEEYYVNFCELCNTMVEMVDSIHRSIKSIKQNGNLALNTDLQCESIIDSLNNIIMYSKSRSPKLQQKIEFELIPLLKDMYLQLYFWGCIYPDKNKMKKYYENEMVDLSANNYIDEAEATGRYKYDISIIVLAYNKLEYTKLCIESLFEYVPKTLNYELILVNHGSTDGTKEYFESLSPTKQLDILKNGGGLGAVYRIVEGKYVLLISNDVLVTENAINNMIKCIQSDNSIAWVVPATPNVSNFQNIDISYNNIKEMYEYSSKNNISNIYKWEQRTKLCNPIDLKESKKFFSRQGLGWGGYFHSLNSVSFPDDKLSLALRRKGYKMMLAKDAYCYHFGSVTLKEENANYKDNKGNKGEAAFYLEGRKEFYSVFGIDPWGTGFCWDKNLFKYLPCNEVGHVDVLGINCGIGSNPLKVRESIKENAHNLDVKIYNITDEKCYIEDLKGVSDVAQYVESIENVESIFKGKKFKYLIFESKLEIYKDPLKIIEKLKRKLQKNGAISIKTSDETLRAKIKSNNIKAIESGEWIIFSSI